MPKIPTFSGSQNIGGLSSFEVANVRQAGQSGRNLQAVGQSLSQFGQSLGDYNEVKRKTEAVLAAGEYSVEAERMSLDLETKLLKSGEVAPDGSNLTQLYASGMQDLKNKASAIPDGQQRQVALNSVKEVETKYLRKLKDREITLFNAHMLNQAEKTAMGISQQLLKDPSSFSKAVQDYDAYVGALPLTEDNKIKISNSTKELAVASVIQGYSEQGNFSAARKALDGDLFPFVKLEDRQKLLKQIEKDEKDYLTDVFKSEDNQFKEMKRTKELNKINTINELFSASETEEGRSIAIKKARGLEASGILSKNDVAALEVRDGDVDKVISDQAHLSFNDRLDQKRSLNTFLDDVSRAVANKSLRPSAARQLYAEYNRSNRISGTPTAKQSSYDEKKNIATGILKAAFPATMQSRMSESEEQARLAKISDAQVLAEQYRRAGLDPATAMRKAIKEIDPNNLVAMSRQRRALEMQSLPKLEEKLQKMKQKKVTNKMTKAEQEEYALLLETLATKKNQLKVTDGAEDDTE